MPLTPATFSIAVNGAIELETTISNAIWSFTPSNLGALTNGSSALRRIFTGSAIGNVTVKARSGYWSSIPSNLSQQSDGSLLVTSATNAYLNVGVVPTLNNIGDRVSVTYENGGKVNLNCAYGSFTMMLYYNFGIYKGSNSEYSSIVNGDVITFEIIDAGSGSKRLVAKKNGTQVVTGEIFTGAVTLSTQIIYNHAVNETYALTFDGSGIAGLTEETATGSITTPPPPPTITSNSPLKIARIGFPYSVQLTADQSGTWSVQTQGNLPSGALASNGLITIPTVGNSNYTFTARITNANGFSDKAFTIPVSNLQIWDSAWAYKKPFEVNSIWRHRVFKPLVGASKAFEDETTKRRLKIDVGYFGKNEGDAIDDFIEAHRLQVPFLFPLYCETEYVTVTIIEAPTKADAENYGGFSLTIEEV